MTTDPFPKEAAVEIDDAAPARFRVGGIAKGSGMIEPMMATMLGVRHDRRAGGAGAAAARAEGGVRRDVQRDHRGRRVLDQRLRVRAGQRRQRRRRSATATSTARGGAAAGVRAAGDRHRPRRRGGDQAGHGRRHRRGARTPRRAGGAGDRQLAAREDRRSTAAIRTGAGSSRSPGASGVEFVLERAPCGSAGGAVQRRRPHDERAPRGGRVSEGHDVVVHGRPRNRRQRHARGCGRATSAPSTCGSTRSTGRERHAGKRRTAWHAVAAFSRSSTSTPASSSACLELAAR